MPISRLEIPLVIALLLLSPNILNLWAAADGSWMRPFVIWSAVIAFMIWLEKQRQNDDL